MTKIPSKYKPLDYTDPSAGTITWPDGIYNQKYVPREFSSDDAMREYACDAKLGNQERTVQKLLDMIATMPCAWADKTGALKAHDKLPFTRTSFCAWRNWSRCMFIVLYICTHLYNQTLYRF